MHKKIKVLMVDDEIKFRETTQKILDRKGFQYHSGGGWKRGAGEIEGKSGCRHSGYQNARNGWTFSPEGNQKSKTGRFP